MTETSLYGVFSGISRRIQALIMALRHKYDKGQWDVKGRVLYEKLSIK